MSKQEAEYDSIAGDYKESKQLSFRKYVEEYTLFSLLGEVQGRKVLDLACGEGFYTRKIKQAGASSILGIDISQEMIQLAEQEEEKRPLGCVYLTRNVLDWKSSEKYDTVSGMYLLNYAASADEIFKFCAVVFDALEKGGSFVGLNDNIHVNPAASCSYKKYGFIKTSILNQKEGDAIRYTFFNKDGSTFQFNNYYLKPQTYEAAFKKAGFSEFSWEGPFLDAGQQSNEFWHDFMTYPPIIGFKAVK